LTLINICAVPDLWGIPPSTAVSTSVTCAFTSRSRGFSSTSSAYLLPSLLVCTSSLKCSLGLKV
uniref:Uncharacterized protein n=1 Tax=Varanus komodoensis TaxID=61221 RepID=A0A8D2J7R6_VARKO